MNDKATEFPTAPLLVRFASMIYELLLVTAVLFITSLPFLYLVGNAQTGWRHLLFQAYLVAVLFAYFGTFWLRSGQTLAMKTWRIRLLGRDGARPTLEQALRRFGFAWLSLLLAGGGFLWALVDRDRQFLHDRLAGTRLVRIPRKSGL